MDYQYIVGICLYDDDFILVNRNDEVFREIRPFLTTLKLNESNFKKQFCQSHFQGNREYPEEVVYECV